MATIKSFLNFEDHLNHVAPKKLGAIWGHLIDKLCPPYTQSLFRLEQSLKSKKYSRSLFDIQNIVIIFALP